MAVINERQSGFPRNCNYPCTSRLVVLLRLRGYLTVTNPKVRPQSEDETLFESEFDDGGPWYDSYKEQLGIFIDIETENDK